MSLDAIPRVYRIARAAQGQAVDRQTPTDRAEDQTQTVRPSSAER
jgi:hypothetical protein